MHSLIGGIFSVLLFSINTSCSQEQKDCLAISEFTYINNTEYSLETPIGLILPNSVLIKKYNDIGPCELTSEDFLPPFRDILTIIVDEIYCKTYNSTSLTVGEGPLDMDNYISEKVEVNSFKFTYTFESNEFENLEECN
ncbi:hypothetical protein [Gillisia sp. Hel_I_86]|uniref:hypothetical protein n=1 Tax=Gillisia sp. Hel_I_86 TaxID=1249981 RepID=UPI001644E83E|nr:hypothetical protein [Gillisia sp. Hel_I_86]